MATRMAERMGQSLPKQCPDWGELKAAYRLLSHPDIEPRDLSQPHRELTMAATGEHAVVLCVQDDTHLAGRCGWECHSTLAVLPQGQLLGLLDQWFFERVVQPPGETRRERELRWRESLVWAEAVERIGPGLPDCHLIHVADRAADNLELIEACRATDVGFVIRASHDRRVQEGADKLWSALA